MNKLLTISMTLILLSCNLSSKNREKGLPLIKNEMKQKEILNVNESTFNQFPSEFDVTFSVFEYYYSNGDFTGISLPQKNLCLFFVFEGMVDNSGFYSILLETQGEYTESYIKTLKKINAERDAEILVQINSIYNLYDSSFKDGILPPEFDEDSENYDSKLIETIDKLEREWYSLSESRNEKMQEYLENNKDALIKIK